MFGQPDQNPVGMYDSMNASVLRANAEMAARRAAANRFQDAERQNTLADSAFARDMASRQFGEQGRQFDSRMNVLRELLARRAPDFYAEPTPAARPAGFAATIGGGSPEEPGGGGFRFNMRGSGGSGPLLQNYLMRYLRG